MFLCISDNVKHPIHCRMFGEDVVFEFLELQDIIRLSIVKFVLCIRMQDMLPPLKWNVFTYPLSKERVTS